MTFSQRVFAGFAIANHEPALVTIHRFYRLRSKTNLSLRPTILRSKVIASTVLMSTILRSTQNDLHQNCFYIINVYRS